MQNNVVDVPEAGQAEAPPAPNRAMKKNPGKGARQRRTDNFRRKVGAKQLQERREEVMKRLGVFDNSCAELEKSLADMHVTVQPTAIPVSVATRGVGFAAVAEYSRMCTTWNFAAINEICTIFQYYRVGLYLSYFKLYLARYEQGEMPSFDAVAPFVLNEEIRQVLAPVTQVPISTYNILSSIGKIEGSCVWHSVPFQQEPANGEQAALFLYPTNIRQRILDLANPLTPVDFRDQFHELNSIPGANWQIVDGHWILQNPDQIWPAVYGANELQIDVHAYCNVLTRVSGRLPPSFISSFTWSAHASKSGLTCMDPVPVSLTSEFVNEPVRQRHVRRRDAQGRAVGVEIPADPAPAYIRDNMNNRSCVAHVWAPESDVTAMELTVGAASFVGEVSEIPTRLQIQGRKSAHLSPGVVLYRLVDAPRSRA